MESFKLPKIYDFNATENKIYDWWEEQGYFKPSNDPNKPGFDPQIKPFVISIPPPNVTGELHLGHAMFVSMEDLMIRAVANSTPVVVTGASNTIEIRRCIIETDNSDAEKKDGEE